MYRDEVSSSESCRNFIELMNLSLAHAEMYLTIAAVFRSFELELYETTVDDVKLHHDTFIAGPQRGSKGVRAHVTERIP
jgi:hypothetical protein